MNRKIKRFNQTKGFTLIEIMVVIGVFGIIAAFTTNMFVSILRGSSKSQILAEVKQNGNYALSVMERMIRNARKIEVYDVSSITILNPDGGSTVFSCDPGQKIASNSASLISEQVLVGDCPNFIAVNEGISGLNPDTVTITFTLQEAGAKTRPEDKARVDFQTTVSLRNVEQDW